MGSQKGSQKEKGRAPILFLSPKGKRRRMIGNIWREISGKMGPQKGKDTSKAPMLFQKGNLRAIVPYFLGQIYGTQGGKNLRVPKRVCKRGRKGIGMPKSRAASKAVLVVSIRPSDHK